MAISIPVKQTYLKSICGTLATVIYYNIYYIFKRFITCIHLYILARRQEMCGSTADIAHVGILQYHTLDPLTLNQRNSVAISVLLDRFV